MKADEQNCQRMMEIIEAYGLAVGQQLNLEKSSVVFSTNTMDDLKKKIVDCVGVPVTDNPDTYLGIFFMWGKIKVVVMAFLKERVHRKLQHWIQT